MRPDANRGNNDEALTPARGTTLAMDFGRTVPGFSAAEASLRRQEEEAAEVLGRLIGQPRH